MCYPKVSVIIPTYNYARYLPDAIESVLSQTFSDYEIVVVDDGSTDNTVEVLQPYMGKIKYIYKENGGLSSARNVGIQNSICEYLVFLDSDDMLMPDKLRIQTAILDDNPEVGFVYSDEYIMHGEDKDNMYRAREGRQLPSGNIFKEFFLNSFIAVMTVMVRRSCLDQVGLFDEGLPCNEDDDLWLRILAKWPATFSDYPSAIRRIHSSNMSRDRLKIEKYLVIVLEKSLNSNPHLVEEFRDKANKRIGELRWSLVERYLRKGDITAAQRELKQCRKLGYSALWKYYFMSLLIVGGRDIAVSGMRCIDYFHKLYRLSRSLLRRAVPEWLIRYSNIRTNE